MISRAALAARLGRRTAAACASGGSANIHYTRSALAHVLLLDGINPLAAEIFENRGHTTVVAPAMTEDELIPVSSCGKRSKVCGTCTLPGLQEISKYDGIIVRSSTQITEKVLKVRSLKLCNTSCVGGFIACKILRTDLNRRLGEI